MDYQEIYTNHADRYDALVEAEDCDGRLLPALESVAPLRGARVLEVGVGTGRITRLIAPLAGRVVGVERSPARIAPPSALAWRKVSHQGVDAARKPRRKTLIPRYGRRDARFDGARPSTFQGRAHGTTPCSNCATI